MPGTRANWPTIYIPSDAAPSLSPWPSPSSPPPPLFPSSSHFFKFLLLSPLSSSSSSPLPPFLLFLFLLPFLLSLSPIPSFSSHSCPPLLIHLPPIPSFASMLQHLLSVFIFLPLGIPYLFPLDCLLRPRVKCIPPALSPRMRVNARECLVSFSSSPSV